MNPKRQMNPTTILRRIAYFLLAYSALAFAAGVFVAEGTLHPGRRSLTDSDQIVGRKLAQQYDSDFALVSISAADGVPLQAWYLRPRTRNGQTVILFHGLSDNRLGAISYARIFLEHGYDVLMPDARAHGASGGDLATYGLRESDDIKPGSTGRRRRSILRAYMDLLNRWEPRDFCNRFNRKNAFAQSSRNPLFQVFGRWPMTVWGNFFAPALG